LVVVVVVVEEEEEEEEEEEAIAAHSCHQIDHPPEKINEKSKDSAPWCKVRSGREPCTTIICISYVHDNFVDAEPCC
jgi:hypothetical protein